MKNIFLEKIHWRHFFGGFSFLIIVFQLITGLFLIFFYAPSLDNAYPSVQHLTNKVTGGSLMRNIHRWIAFFLFLTILIHTIRCMLRLDFMNSSKKVLWLTGVLLVLPIFLLTVTGLILPWEWKGYWFMEIIPNHSEFVPFIGHKLKSFFIESFTLPRYQVIHILVLPIIFLILINYHFLDKLRKRGMFTYIYRHSLLSLPLLIAIVILAKYITIPSEDPEVIPMPLEGEYIPAPEWYYLILLLPLIYFKGSLIPILTIYIPFIVFISFAFLPYYLKGRAVREESEATGYNNSTPLKKIFIRGSLVVIIFAICASLIYLGAYHSPTLGCNGCHHIKNGFRMGVVPKQFKDRNVLPNLDDNQWMMGHWFYPTEIY